MIILWIIGWMFTIGILLADEAFDQTPKLITGLIAISFVFYWPVVIGYCAGSLGLAGNEKKEDPK